jgi:hypothetical protein
LALDILEEFDSLLVCRSSERNRKGNAGLGRFRNGNESGSALVWCGKPRVGEGMLLIANPIYDSVFKVLLGDGETARGFVAALIGMRVVDLRLVAQEHARREAGTGDLKVFRLDFCATVETGTGRRFQVLIELQKANLGGNTLRFRHYLGSRYQTVEEVMIDGSPRKVSLPIISVFLLGYVLDAKLPMAVSVKRRYADAVSGAEVGQSEPHEFIEQLTHDALFVQIPMIRGESGTPLERVLAVFDQRRVVPGDVHRLAVEEDLGETDVLLGRMLRILNRLQESPEMEQLMTLEDVYQLEQQQMALELEAARQALRKDRERLEQEQRRREEEQRRREEEQRRREEAEREVERLRQLLGELGQE